jgi:hypothetical protein
MMEIRFKFTGTPGEISSKKVGSSCQNNNVTGEALAISKFG